MKALAVDLIDGRNGRQLSFHIIILLLMKNLESNSMDTLLLDDSGLSAVSPFVIVEIPAALDLPNRLRDNTDSQS